MLRLEGVSCAYGGVVAIRDVDLEVSAGSVVALMGPNGAGKSTILKCASGLVRPLAGRIWFDGHDITRFSPQRRARLGLRHVPEGRQIFPEMTVRDNITVAAPFARRRTLDTALHYFPQLEGHLGRKAGSLSGGQQQMLALARALVSKPRFLMIDELSLGLAPLVVDELVATLRRVRDDGVTLLVVEQHVQVARDLADFGATMIKSRLTATEPITDILSRAETVEAVYLGRAGEEALAGKLEAGRAREESHARWLARSASIALGREPRQDSGAPSGAGDLQDPDDESRDPRT
jgi:branched-chain amino acid transport system ATP-binding protein